MSNFKHNPETGEVFIHDGLKWRAATDKEVSVARAGIVGQVGSAIEGATGIPGMVDPELGSALRSVNPKSSAAGTVASVAGGVTGIAKGTIKKGLGSTLTERVTGRVGLGSDPAIGSLSKPLAARVSNPYLKGALRATEVLPGLGAIPLARRIGNLRKVNRYVARGLGSNSYMKAGDHLFDGLDATTIPTLNKNISAFTAKVPASAIDEVAATSLVDDLVNKGLVKTQPSGASVTPAELARVRNELADLQHKNLESIVRARVDNAIEEIDEIVAEAIESSTTPAAKESLKQHKALVDKSKLWAAARPRGKQETIEALNARMEDAYGAAYREGRLEDLNLSPEIAQALKNIRRATGYEVGALGSIEAGISRQTTGIATAGGVGAGIGIFGN